MLRKINLSGIGLGLYLIGLGICFILQQTNGLHIISFWLRLYPIFIILLGLDFFLTGTERTARIFTKPSPMVITIIIIMIIIGSISTFHLPIVEFASQFNHSGDWDNGPFDWDNGPHFTLDQEFKPPQGVTTVEVQNQSGNIQVDSVTGNTLSAKAQIKLKFRHKPPLRKPFRLVGEVLGDTFLLRLVPPEGYSSFDHHYFRSNIILNIPSRLSVTIKNSSGDIEAGTLCGNLNVETLSGDIRVKSIGHDLRLSSKSGDIDIDNVKGNADISTKSGEINISKINGCSRIESLSGEVTLKETYGPVNAELKSGNLNIGFAKINGNCDIECISGNIELGFPAGAGFALDAEVTAGNIDSDLNVAVERKFAGLTAHGEVNGGGPMIKVRSISGNIRLQEF